MTDRTRGRVGGVAWLAALASLVIGGLAVGAGESRADGGLLGGLLGTTTTTQPAAPPPGPAPLVPDDQADDGQAHLVAVGHSEPCGCAPGTYTLTARLRGQGARAWLTVDGQRVGEWALDDTYREVQAVVALTGPGALLGLQSVPPSPGAPAGEVLLDWLAVAPASPQHTTAGRNILGPNGLPTTMLGVAKGGFGFNGPDFHMGEEDAAALADWGVAVVRLFASQEYWNPASCSYDPTYADRIDAEVALLNARGMYVILDDHHSQRGDSCAPGDNAAMADDGSVAYWLDVATRFKDDPLVGFDLYNEPHDVTWETWRDGGDAGGFHTPGMQALYDTVRSTGATNLVFVSGPGWANDLGPALEMPIDGSGIVYAAHAYCFRCPTDSNGMPRYFEDSIAPAAAVQPVAILEFGVSTLDAGLFNRRVITWAEAHQVGWTAYSWSNRSEADPYGLLRHAGGYEPNLNGVPVRSALRAAAFG